MSLDKTKNWEKFIKKSDKKENYSYQRNHPKNKPNIQLKSFEENYNYSYPYALYSGEKHKNQPSKRDENNWPGVL